MKLIDIILGKEPRGAWFWLIAVITLLMLFAPRCAHAQFAVEQPFFGQTLASVVPWAPTNISNARFWFVSSDSQTTGTIITNWVDRIHGLQLTNLTTVGPIKSNDVAVFYGTNSLRFKDIFYDSNVPNGSNYSIYLVIRPYAQTAGFPPIISTSSSASYAGGRGIFAKNNNKIQHWAASGNSEVASFVNNQLFDIGFDTTNGIGSATYTNGLLSVRTPEYNLGYFATTGEDTPATYFYTGEIMEMVWYTNAAGLSSINVSNLHWYSTNKYLFSP